jgi:hypothetical protein
MITINESELKLIIQNHLRHTKAIRCEQTDIHINTESDSVLVFVYKEEE